MSDEPIKRITQLILFQAQQDDAAKMVVDLSAGTGSAMRYRADGTLHELSPPPRHVVSGVVAELGRLANLPSGPFPKEGLVDLKFGAVRLQWKLAVAGPNAPCILTLVES